MTLERILTAARNSAKTAQGKSFVDSIDYARDYAEPGYGPAKLGVLFANWNDITEYREGGVNGLGERVKVDDVPSRVSDALEHAGYDIEWSDEWTTCGSCGKAVRTSANSYGWTRSYSEQDGDVSCAACTLEDPAGYLEALEGNSDAAVTLDVDPAWMPRVSCSSLDWHTNTSTGRSSTWRNHETSSRRRPEGRLRIVGRSGDARSWFNAAH